MHLKGISRNIKQVPFLTKDSRFYSQDDPFWIKKKAESCMPLSEHSLLTWACVQQDFCKVLSHRKGSTQRTEHQKSWLLQSNLLSGRLGGHFSAVFCSWRSVKNLFDTTKGDKDFYQTSTEGLGLLPFFQLTGRRNSTMYSPAVLLRLLLLSYFVEKAERHQFFITGPLP